MWVLQKGQFSLAIFVLGITLPGVVLALSMDDVHIQESKLPEYQANETRSMYHAEMQMAVLYMEGAGTSTPGATTSVRVMVDPGLESINTASLYIAYPTDLLEFVGHDPSESHFSFSFLEYHDADIGVVAYHSLQPYPGISEIAPVVDLMFESLAPGTSTIYFLSDSGVLANDGYATDILGATGIYRLVSNY